MRAGLALLALLAPLFVGPQEELGVDMRFEGTPEAALAAIERLGDDEPERAVAIARQLAQDEGHGEALRGELRYAEGLVLARAGSAEQAVRAFASARALAGPGALRADATYCEGTVLLELAEARRAETLRGLADPAAAGSGRMPAAPPSASREEDPLGALRRAYLRAKEVLVLGLRDALEQGRDPGDDLRANLELIQRRLREIDALEEQEEEQDPQPEAPEQPPQDGESEEEQEAEQDEPQPEQEGSEGERQPSEGESPTGQEPEPGEPEPTPRPEEDEAPAPQPVDLESLPEPEREAAGAEPAERLLSREQVLRLLERLADLEEEREALERALRATRRIPVEKDW